jgi:hypothetical protein
MEEKFKLQNQDVQLKKEKSLRDSGDDKSFEVDDVNILEHVGINEQITQETVEKEKDFTERLSDLQQAISEMDKHGGQITESIFENIMDMKFSEFESLAHSGALIKDKDARSLHEKVSGILNHELVDDSHEYKGSRFRQIMNKPVSKVLFSALCLFLKFGTPAVQAHEATVQEPGEAGTKIEQGYDGGNNLKTKTPENTYQFNAHEKTLVESKDSTIMNMAQGFEIDKADISPEDAKKIIAEYDAFLDKINAKNIDDALAKEEVIEASSDERATKYGESNKKLAPTLENNVNLTTDRAHTAAKLLTEVKQKHDFSKSDAPQDKLEKYKQKEFKFKVPEKGYTKITELHEINPKTGVEYPDMDVADLKKSDPKLFDALTEKCRYVNIDLKIESKTIIEKINQYDRIIFFVDNSPSTEYTMDDMARNLEELGLQENGKGEIAKADLVYYADVASPAKHLPDILAAAKDLRQTKVKGSSLEKPFQSSIVYLNELIKNDQEIVKNGGKVEDYRGAIFTADEGLQEAENIFEVTKLLEKANIKDANVRLYSRDGNLPIEKNLFEIKDQVEKFMTAKMSADSAALEQAKITETMNLNKLIAAVNEKVDSKVIQDFFGQEKIDNVEVITKILEKGDFKKPHLQKSAQSYQYILNKLLSSGMALVKTNNLLDKAKNQTFEDYLKTTKIEIKVFTDKNGRQVNFDVLGYEANKDKKHVSVKL